MSLQDIKEDLLIADLIVKSVKDELKAEERILLQAWLDKDEKNRALFKELSSEEINKELSSLPTYSLEKAEARVLSRIRETRTIPWKLYAASVAAIAIIYFGFYFIEQRRADETIHFTEQREKVTTGGDIQAPKSTNAVLTLADGTILHLDSLDKGEVPGSIGGHIKKLSDGRLVYDNVPATDKEVEYNTLTVPFGSRIVALTLSDGTSVTLNAGSSITFPTSFPGAQRTVMMTGEIYFEIAHNKSKPFIVKKGDAQIQVLGTHFNVNAYDNESTINVTLVEGSVKVSLKTDDQVMILRPGQLVKISSGMELVNNVNLDEILAWKQGRFHFGEQSSIESVMRQISRWYDVEIEYRGKVEGHLGGSIERESNVSQVLKILEMTGVVKFQLEGRKVIVLSR
jgi:transmembrane sensor